jgi:hypothetical protein
LAAAAGEPEALGDGYVMLKSFTIDDDLAGQDAGAIEVTLHLQNADRRWCYFMTPTALASCGDLIPGTKIHFHFGAPHMIVVAARLDRPIIERALRDIDSRGELKECSRALE